MEGGTISTVDTIIIVIYLIGIMAVGILDEISGYSRALSAEEVRAAFQANRPTVAPPFRQRYWPRGPDTLPKEFNAYLTQLKYYPAYDALWRSDAPQDIVVTFDKVPMRIVARRGIRSAPCMVIRNNTIDNDICAAPSKPRRIVRCKTSRSRFSVGATKPHVSRLTATTFPAANIELAT